MKTTFAIFAMLVAGLAASVALAAPVPILGGQYRYWAFTNHNDLRDVLAYWAPGPFHVQLEYWDFVNPATDDEFRPEVGIHLRDHRRSVYTIQWRHEHDRERYTLGTDQVLSKHWVGRVAVSPIVGRDSTVWVAEAGADYYWGSYNFCSATVVRDPREDGLWVVPLRVRLANERNDWLQLTVAPASQRSVGWALESKLRWLRLGIERNNRYDFTNLDNTIYTVGFEIPLRKAE